MIINRTEPVLVRSKQYIACVYDVIGFVLVTPLPVK